MTEMYRFNKLETNGWLTDQEDEDSKIYRKEITGWTRIEIQLVNGENKVFQRDSKKYKNVILQDGLLVLE